MRVRVLHAVRVIPDIVRVDQGMIVVADGMRVRHVVVVIRDGVRMRHPVLVRECVIVIADRVFVHVLVRVVLDGVRVIRCRKAMIVTGQCEVVNVLGQVCRADGEAGPTCLFKQRAVVSRGVESDGHPASKVRSLAARVR